MKVDEIKTWSDTRFSFAFITSSNFPSGQPKMSVNIKKMNRSL